MPVPTKKPTDSVEDEGIRNLPPLPPHRHPIRSDPVPSMTGPAPRFLLPIIPPFKLPQPIKSIFRTPHLAVPLLQVQVSQPLFSINLIRRTDPRGLPRKTEPSIPSSQKTNCWIPGTSLDWLRMLHRWVCFISASLAMWGFSAGLFIFQVRTLCQQSASSAEREEGQ
jgi:hypothetical protein